MHVHIRQHLTKLCPDLGEARGQKQKEVLVSMLADFVGIFFYIGVNNMNWVFPKAKSVWYLRHIGRAQSYVF